MSSIEDDVQQLISRAVTLSIKAPMLTLPQVMRAAKFTNAQSEDRGLQMRVRRAAKSKGPSKSAPTPPHIGSEVDLDTPMPTVLTVTKSSSGGTSATTLVSDELSWKCRLCRVVKIVSKICRADMPATWWRHVGPHVGNMWSVVTLFWPTPSATCWHVADMSACDGLF